MIEMRKEVKDHKIEKYVIGCSAGFLTGNVSCYNVSHHGAFWSL